MSGARATAERLERRLGRGLQTVSGAFRGLARARPSKAFGGPPSCAAGALGVGEEVQSALGWVRRGYVPVGAPWSRPRPVLHLRVFAFQSPLMVVLDTLRPRRRLGGLLPRAQPLASLGAPGPLGGDQPGGGLRGEAWARRPAWPCEGSQLVLWRSKAFQRPPSFSKACQVLPRPSKELRVFNAFRKLPRDAKTFHGLSRALQGLPRPAEALQGLSRQAKACQAAPRPSKAFQGLPRPPTTFHDLPRAVHTHRGDRAYTTTPKSPQ